MFVISYQVRRHNRTGNRIQETNETSEYTTNPKSKWLNIGCDALLQSCAIAVNAMVIKFAVLLLSFSSILPNTFNNIIVNNVQITLQHAFVQKAGI